MGGLWRKMPVTTWTFVIGGLSLAGFPLITAGFWSKDEIFAEAWHIGAKNGLALLVLILLGFAALFTALYTLRQIGMTFFGEPRTEAARYAQHYYPKTVENRNISAQLTAPLIVLAFFAIVAGFAGVNPGFWILGPALEGIGIYAPFGHWVGYSLPVEPEHIDFSIFPVIISFGVFILGAGLGYRLYFRRRVNTESDPIAEFMGPSLYKLISNKYYIEETYKRYLVRPLTWVSEVVTPQIIDRGIIDRSLHILAEAAIVIGNFIKRFNEVVIDGVGDGIPESIADIGRAARQIQNGRIQRYLLYSLVGAVVIGVNIALIALVPGSTLTVILLAELLLLVLMVVVYLANNRQSAPTTGETGGTD
jgi:NADH-quinone oxidoreductase subunit L